MYRRTGIFLILLVTIKKYLSSDSLKNLNSDCATLKEMSKVLNKKMKNPNIEAGDILLSNIEKFNDVLWDIREAIREGNNSVIEDIRPIINVTLPSFVKTFETLSRRDNKDKRKELYKTFNWTDKVRKRFEYLCVETKFHWETLQVVYDLKNRKII